MIGVVLTVAASIQPFLPSPHDQHGWGLRVHALSISNPLLAGERIDHHQFWVTLINFSDRPQFHDPLIVAYGSGALDVAVLRPDGKSIVALSLTKRGRDPFTVPMKVPPGEVSSLDFAFSNFGYHRVTSPGRHRVEATFALNTDGKPDGRVLTAPPVEFEVLDIQAETVLSEHRVPLEGWELRRPKDEQTRSFVRQVKVGDRTFLIYRWYHGPKLAEGVDPALWPLVEIAGTYRLAELPGKCEMTVEGAYGDFKPLTITYRTVPDAKPTRLVINSVSGSPWTEEEERLLQERLSRVAPMPRPVARP